MQQRQQQRALPGVFVQSRSSHCGAVVGSWVAAHRSPLLVEHVHDLVVAWPAENASGERNVSESFNISSGSGDLKKTGAVV